MTGRLLALLLLTNLRGCFGQAPEVPAPADSVSATAAPDSVARAARPAYSAAVYRAELRHLEARRAQLAAQYRRARTPAARTATLGAARHLLLAAFDSTIFPAWAGTTWNFYGTTWEPRRGTVACGYFVTTALHDAGLRLDRTLLAKQASEVIVRNLAAESAIHRYRGLAQTEFVRRLRALGPGLYVVGLDFHVGFLRVYPGGTVRMVHSTYLKPGAVVDELAVSSAALVSNYRVVGSLTANDALLRTWLLNQPLTTRGATVTR